MLLSTGLDSLLAFHLLNRIGVEVVALIVKTTFNNINEKVLKEVKKEAKVIIYEAEEDYLQIIKNPKFVIENK